ncbi:MAG: sensor domain-containing diguanylate cyclase [Novosphingobium sp.]|nr:sensor domain-containing diguanylate cyclase [Novosphingobium sp.]
MTGKVNWRVWRLPLAGGVLYCLLAALAISLTTRSGGVAAAWPANAAIVAILLLSRKDEWHRYLLMAFAGNVFANIIARGAVFGPALFGLANIVEIAIVAWALHRQVGRTGKLFVDRMSLTAFLLWAGVVAPLASSLLGAATASSLFGQDLVQSQTLWYCSDALGLILFTPFFFSLFDGDYARCFHGRSSAGLIEGALLHVFVALSTAIFLQTRLPLLFLPFIPLMLVTFRLGWLGTSTSVLIIALAGIRASLQGTGPIAMIDTDPQGHILFLQFYLACLVLVNMPVAATLTVKRDLIARLHEDERMIELLSRNSAVTLLSFDPAGRCTKAAGQTTGMFAKQPDEMREMALEDIFGSHGDVCLQAYIAALDEPETPARCELMFDDGRCLEAVFTAVYEADDTFSGALATITEVTQRKREHLRLLEVAHTDSLTGVLNRAGFMDHLADAMAQEKPRFCLALIDLDQFKAINDTFGHLTGDEALIRLTRILQRSVRSRDIIARLGGDEFVMLIRDARLAYATNVCDRLVRSVSAKPMLVVNAAPITLTISCGLVEYEAGESSDRLIDRVDMALYSAKGCGRNCLRAA